MYLEYCACLESTLLTPGVEAAAPCSPGAQTTGMLEWRQGWEEVIKGSVVLPFVYLLSRQLKSPQFP
jgi:hypothetical protein